MACGRLDRAAPHPQGSGEDRNIDTARTIEGGIGHDLPQEAPGAFADAMLKAGRLYLACRKEGEEMDEDVAFARDIRPLFSNRDVSSMSRFFDLSSYDDVRANAERIYRRLADGTMPCYGPWPADNVQHFRTWIDNGFAP
jgi:hypothetical protein